MKLTQVERTILANQLRILQALDPSPAGHTEAAIRALDEGFEGYYPEILTRSEVVSVAECNEVMDILSLYLAIFHRTGEPMNLKEEDRYWMQFRGFDLNTHPGHFEYARFVRRDLGRFTELQDAPDNSHTSTSLVKYRTMLEVWKELPTDRKHTPTGEDVARLVGGLPKPRLMY